MRAGAPSTPVSNTNATDRRTAVGNAPGVSPWVVYLHQT